MAGSTLNPRTSRTTGGREMAQHVSAVWAPSPDRRLAAVQAELSTLATLRDARPLSAAENRYQEHLLRREGELHEEIVEEARVQARR